MHWHIYTNLYSFLLIIHHMAEDAPRPGSNARGISILPFPCILACFAGHFLYIFAVFAGFACKNSKNIHFVSAVGAKRTENGNALLE